MKITEGDIAGLRAIHASEPVTADALAKLEHMGFVHVVATLTPEGKRVLSESLTQARVASRPGFAANALAAAKSCRTGKWGESKVFISHVWRVYRRVHGPMSLDEFKASLIKAQREGKLSLSRADLTSAMPARDVKESEVRSLGADFHFVRVER